MARAANIQSFSPQEFERVVTTAIHAGQRHPQVMLTAADQPAPYTEAAAAVRALYADDHARFASAMQRFAALMQLFTANGLGPFVRPSRAGTHASDIHPAVIHVAAQMRLTDSMKFPPKRFLAAVAEVAQHRYPEVDGWS